MSSGKHLVYAWITYLFAFCGIAGFYFDIRTGKLIKSRVLCIYSRLLSLFILSTFPTMINIYWIKAPTFLTQSKLTVVLIIAYPTSSLITVLSCIFCVNRWQHRIFKLMEDLLKMEEFAIEPNYSITPSQQPYLRRLFWIRFLLLMGEDVVFILRMLLGQSGFFFYYSVLVARVMKGGLYFLLFNLIWQISYTFMKLQTYLENLLFQPMPMSRKQTKLLELHRMYCRLVHMINELCIIFKYPLACCLLKLTCNSCLSGYTLFRLLFGKPMKSFAPKTDWLILTLSVSDALELYILASIANTAGDLHDSTFHILRYPYFDLDLLERSNDWLALQLIWQNKNIHIFGVLNINLRLVFIFITSMVLHIIYMIQSDYDYLSI
nr:putative gustatory receptor 85a [Drosophila virilis]